MKTIESIEFTLIRTKNYSLKPFGKFKVKWCPSKAMLAKPNVLGFDQISFDSRTEMPYTPEQFKAISTYMIKNKSDVLTDGYDYFTFMGSGLVEIRHDKLRRYKNYLDQRELVDSEEVWENYLLRL